MDSFEYQITSHGAEEFTRMMYFCSADGDCGLEEVPANEPQALTKALNERGLEGWELVQLMFGKDGAHVYDKEWCMSEAKKLYIRVVDKQPGIAKNVLEMMMKSLNMFEKKEENNVSDVQKKAAAAQKMWVDRKNRRNGVAKKKAE